MTAKITAGSASVPDSELSASTRKTGISASRTKPIALGIVQTFHGWPRSVCGGGGPERSRPASRRKRQPRLLDALRRRLARLLDALGRRAPPARAACLRDRRPQLGHRLDGARPAARRPRRRAGRGGSAPPPRPPPASAGRPSAAAGSRAARRRRTSRPARRRGRRAAPRSPAARSSSYRRSAAASSSEPALPSATISMSHGASAFGQAIPFSSPNCSTAAAAIRAGPIP